MGAENFSIVPTGLWLSFSSAPGIPRAVRGLHAGLITIAPPGLVRGSYGSDAGCSRRQCRTYGARMRFAHSHPTLTGWASFFRPFGAGPWLIGGAMQVVVAASAAPTALGCVLRIRAQPLRVGLGSFAPPAGRFLSLGAVGVAGRWPRDKFIGMVIRTSLFVVLRLFGRGVCVLFAGLVLFGSSVLAAQSKQPVWSAEEKPIADQISGLRALPDDFRGKMTQQLAIQIRRLPATENKLRLAYGLANLATEGDPGGETTLQDVATTLADTLAEVKPSASGGRPSAAYVELARLVRYEHVEAKSDDPQFGAAMAELEADDARLRQPDFTLTDLDGKSWTLSELRGKVVLVNFWATWCPPCRKEMPDLEALHGRFSANDLVILGISDEKAETVKAFLAQKNYTYTIALDPGRKVSEQFGVEGIPKTFVFDRDGNLVAQSMDMRTGKQFLEMLASAGLK